MVHNKLIQIPKERFDTLKKILAIEEGRCDDYDSDEAIATFTAHFDNGFQADIKVCNGDTPWVEGVLFDEFGNEKASEYSETELLGAYSFLVGDDEYFVHVEIAA